MECETSEEIAETRKRNPQAPVSVPVFCSMIAVLILTTTAIGFVVARYVWSRELAWWEVAILVGVAMIAILVALVASKAIPTNSRSFEEWRRPATIGALAYSVLLVGLAVPLTIVPLLGREPRPFTPPQPPPQIPESEPMLAGERVAGRWGEGDDCDVAYDVTIIKQAVRIERDAEGLRPFLMIGTIKAETVDMLTIAVREPSEAAGQTLDLRLEDDGMTRRLLWDEVRMDVPLKLHPCGGGE